jgi:lysyl-tRNA synthetase class 2
MPSTKWTSSLLADAVFHPDSQELELIFHSGAIYRYRAVPNQIYQDLLHAESKGTYFNSILRNRFPFVKVNSANSASTGLRTAVR